jgi:hypothetical protein
MSRRTDQDLDDLTEALSSHLQKESVVVAGAGSWPRCVREVRVSR